MTDEQLVEKKLRSIEQYIRELRNVEFKTFESFRTGRLLHSKKWFATATCLSMLITEWMTLSHTAYSKNSSGISMRLLG
jgi:hypothetical protein